MDSVDLKNLESFKETEEKKEKPAELNKDDQLHFDSLLARIKEILGDRVTDVRKSERLSGSPAILVNPDDSMSSSMQKMMRMMNKDMGIPKKIFEINRDHKLIRNLLKVFKANRNDEYINNVVEELFESSLLLEGDLMDPHKLVSKINQMLEQSSDWYTEVKKIN